MYFLIFQNDCDELQSFLLAVLDNLEKIISKDSPGPNPPGGPSSTTQISITSSVDDSLSM